MGDSTMFLTPPPNSTMGGVYYRTFLCSKLRVLTICYRLEILYISILGLLTYIKRKKIICPSAARSLYGGYFHGSQP